MYKIIINRGEPDEGVFVLSSALITIGRSDENTISLPDRDSLSRKHARIDIKDDQIVLTDLKSKNGTFVNEKRIKRAAIAPGNKFRCGDVSFLLMKEEEGARIPAFQPLRKEIFNSDAIPIQTLQLKDSDKGNDPTIYEQNLEALLRVAEILSSPEDVPLVLRKIVDLVLQMLDVDRVAILLINEKTGEIEQHLGRTKSDIQSDRIYSHHIVEYVVRENVSVLSADTQSDFRFEQAESVQNQSIRSSMCVPLRAQNQVIGAIYVDNLLLANRFSVGELKFLDGFANQAGLAIQNSRLYKQLEEEARLREEKLILLVEERTRNLLEQKKQLDHVCEKVSELARNLEIRNRFIQQTFGRYLSPEVVASLLESPEKLQLGGESRKVSILLSDLRGFTAVTEQLVPAEVLRLLNHYLGEMAKIILKFRGTIFEFIGDAILAVFGVPISADDDAERAVACAVAMQQAMNQVNQYNIEEHLPQLQMGISVHTGEVIVGNIGSEERTKYGIVGPALNLAARMESATLGGQILISESTMNLVRNLVIAKRKSSISMKGLNNPIIVYDIRGIEGLHNLLLPDQGESSEKLDQEIRIRYSMLNEKQIDDEMFDGKILTLNARGAEIYSEHELSPFQNLKVRFVTKDKQQFEVDLYGKVLSMNSDNHTFSIHWTSVSPQAEALLTAKRTNGGSVPVSTTNR